VDDDREREGVIREQLESAATKDDKLLVQKYFMTVLHHGDVVINRSVDHTKHFIMHGADVPSSKRFQIQRKDAAIPNANISSTGAAPSISVGGEWLTRATHGGSYKYSNKVHYRIVFQEVAKPIYSLTMLSDVLRSLEHAATGKRPRCVLGH
jgi:hypothetical protein